MSSAPKNIDFSIEVGDRLLGIAIEDYTPESPGFYSGPPEMCYPSEDEEINWHAFDGDNEVYWDELGENDVNAITKAASSHLKKARMSDASVDYDAVYADIMNY